MRDLYPQGVIIKIEAFTSAKNICTIRLTGRLDMKGVVLSDTKLTRLIDAENDLVILDLSGIEFLASIGLHLLIQNAKSLSQRGGRLVFCELPPPIKKVIEIAGIDMIIDVYGTVGDAMRDA